MNVLIKRAFKHVSDNLMVYLFILVYIVILSYYFYRFLSINAQFN